MSRRVALLVGEAPGPRTDPDRAVPLYPYPPRCAGHRLYGLTGLRSEDLYLRAYDRVNVMRVFQSGWPRLLTRQSFVERVVPRMRLHERTVLVGQKPRDTFAALYPEHGRELGLAGPFGWTPWGDHRVAWMPHPSGRNMYWNDAANRQTAREFFVELQRTVPNSEWPSLGEAMAQIRLDQGRGEAAA